MGKIMSILRRAPKRTSALVAIFIAAIIVPATLFAWGPTRPTYTMAKPADHVTFDSITDNPNIGDERNFVGIRETGTTAKWSDDMTVQSGKEYTVRLYVHNNAASNLKLVAKDVTAMVNLPTTTGKSIRVDGYITSSNASPKQVYDSATFTSGSNFNLAYVKGSLIYENNVKTFTLPESIFTSKGAELGYSSMNGQIPGCLQYAGYVSFTVKPQFAPNTSFTMSKMVSKHGENKWSKSVSVNPGDTVDYLIQYKNTGNVVDNSVTIRDKLPAGETYINGSTIFANSTYPTGKTASDNIANGTGINIGTYAAGASAWAEFSAKVADNDDLANCGNNTLINSANVNVNGYSISDTANVVVNKECKTVTPVYSCDGLTADLVSDNTYKFNGSATAENGATVKNYTFDFGDNASQTVTNPVDVMHTYTDTNATYTANLNVTFNVNGSEKTVTGDSCSVSITVSKPPVNECKPGIPEGDVRCTQTPPVTPVTPSNVLPTTGAGEDLSAFFGLGSLATAFGYYRASRRRG